MDTDLIKQDWAALAGRRVQFTRGFYDALFERHPQYRALFPEYLDSQMEKMVEMFSSIARFADHTDLIEPYLRQVGFAHRRFSIHHEDADNFKKVFLDTLEHQLAEGWNEAHRAAWTEAFDDLIIPLFDEGLDRGR